MSIAKYIPQPQLKYRILVSAQNVLLRLFVVSPHHQLQVTIIFFLLLLISLPLLELPQMETSRSIYLWLALFT